MADNLFEAKYDITKKSKLKKFYELNKILIFSSILILIIVFVSFNFYLGKATNTAPVTQNDKIIVSSIFPQLEATGVHHQGLQK